MQRDSETNREADYIMKGDELPSDSPMLRDFKRAYHRLKNRKPESIENIELMQLGKLRINKSTLAEEADHSRTNYLNHPDVLEYVETKLGSRPRAPREAPDLEGTNRTLRSQIRTLQTALDDMQTQNAELIAYIHALEKEFKVVIRPTSPDNPFGETITGRARKNPAAVRDMRERPKLGKSGKNTL